MLDVRCWRKSGRKLQYFPDNRDRDHHPLAACFVYSFAAQLSLPSSAARFDRDAIARCLAHGHLRHEFLETVEAEIGGSAESRSAASTELTTDNRWAILLGCLDRAAAEVFPKKQEKRWSPDKADTDLEKKRSQLSLDAASDADAEKIKVLSRILGNRRRAARRTWRKDIGTELSEACAQGRFAEAHRLSTVLAGTGVAVKRRWYNSCNSAAPSKSEWEELAVRDPGRGGLGAVKLSNFEEAMAQHKSEAAVLLDSMPGEDAIEEKMRSKICGLLDGLWLALTDVALHPRGASLPRCFS